MQILKVFKFQKTMESEIQKIFIRTNIMLYAVKAMNQYVLMIKLAREN